MPFFAQELRWQRTLRQIHGPVSGSPGVSSAGAGNADLLRTTSEGELRKAANGEKKNVSR